MNEMKSILQKAVELINGNRFSEAEKLLEKAVIENVTSPEVYNLYGILAEYHADYSLAAKFYRAAYAFDPSYQPASNNLGRITCFFQKPEKKSIDFGGGANESAGNDYYVEYDEFHIGHIKKKTC